MSFYSPDFALLAQNDHKSSQILRNILSFFVSVKFSKALSLMWMGQGGKETIKNE